MPARGCLLGVCLLGGLGTYSFSEMFILLEPFSVGVMGEWVFHCFFVLIKLLIHWCNGQKQSLSLVNNKNKNINNDKTSSPPI